MRTHSEIVGWQTGPETGDTFFGKRFTYAVNDARVGKLTIRTSFLLLHLSFNVVEWKGAKSYCDGSNHRATELDLEWGGLGA